MHQVGYAAVASAADRAVAPPSDDALLRSVLERDQVGGPVGDPDEPCPGLEREVQEFLDDPITVAYGVSELAGSVSRGHVRRHKCQGWGRP